MTSITGQTALLHFGLAMHEIVTANPDGSIPLNAKCGPAVVEACIAQANLTPGLLDALREAESFVDRHSEAWYKSGQELLTKIRAAIAKAEGRS